MIEFFRSRVLSFRYAFSGWWYVIRTQRNAWIHAVFSLVVILMCLWLGLTNLEWALIIGAIAMVWTAEFVNTALEAMVDLASPSRNHLARVSKDVGAAAVLIASLASALIGLLVMGPPLLARLSALLGLP
jgi:diacylglycerol kinase